MLYRRYFFVLSLLLITSMVFVMISKSFSATTHKKLRVRKSHPVTERIHREFQWATTMDPIKAAKTIPTTAKPTKKSKRIFASEIIKKQPELIAQEMGETTFPDPARPKLSDYVPAAGGRPMSYLVMSSWGTHYSILEDILSTVPGNYFIHEPLTRFKITQLNETQAPAALDELKHIMDCKYSKAIEYLKEAGGNWGPVEKNKRLWSQCRQRKELCFAPVFLNAICKQFPIKTMSILRLRLAALSDWLAEEGSNIRIVFLVRDPRAMMQARITKGWCKNQPDCVESKRVCQYMEDDRVAYKKLVLEYPDRVKLIRFEDLALHPFDEVEKLLEFLQAPYSEKTKEFLMMRTEESPQGGSSSVRQLRTPPFLWRDRILYEKFAEIQQDCVNVTTGWGYRLMDNVTLADQKFSPLGRLPDEEKVVVIKR